VKALGALAVAERDIHTRFARMDSARSDDVTPSRAHLALSIHQASHRNSIADSHTPPQPIHSLRSFIPRTVSSRHEGATARADAN